MCVFFCFFSNSCSIEWGCYASIVITGSVLLATYDAMSKWQKVKVVVRRVGGCIY